MSVVSLALPCNGGGGVVIFLCLVVLVIPAVGALISSRIGIVSRCNAGPDKSGQCARLRF